MLKPTQFAVIGHECVLIVEYPDAYCPNQKRSNSGLFRMGVSYTYECILEGLRKSETLQENGFLEEYRSCYKQDTRPSQALEYERQDFRRIRLMRGGDDDAPRLVIREADSVVLNEADRDAVAAPKPYLQWKTTRRRLPMLVVYWNVDHIQSDDDATIAMRGKCLKSCDEAQILIMQLSATAEVPQSVATSTLKDFQSCIERRSGRPTIIVTNTSSLDYLGVTLHRGSSWERFADDLQWELTSKAPSTVVQLLLSCDYVVVRGSDSATVVVTMKRRRAEEIDMPRKEPARLQLYYPVTPRIVPMSHDGYLVGGTNLVMSAIASQTILGDGNVDRIAEYVDAGVREGVRRNVLFEQRGYLDQEGKMVDRHWHVSVVRAARSLNETDRKWTIGCEAVGVAPVWSLTKSKISGIGVTESREAPAKRKTCFEEEDTWSDEQRGFGRPAHVAAFLVRNGVQRAAQEFHFPVAQLGKAFVVDRFEYEQYMEMQAVMRSYLLRAPADDGRPLSLAVFGRPGAGKSFGIKQLPKTIGVKGLREQPIEANVSQFETLDDLAVTLHKARDVALDGGTPLVLWDEFDCEHGGRPFGWFRYFLAPMQDGTFTQRQVQYKIGRAIFVFIGGVNHNFDMFSGRMRDHEFIQAKGPDFASRIRAHLDIKDISRSDDDMVYLLRRAVFLRSFLMKYHRAIVHERACDDGNCGSDRACIRVAPEVLRAFLMVDRYEHGVRSLEALVQMCMVAPGQSRLSWSALPSPEQMEGHVSAREFQASGKEQMPLCVFE